MLNLKEQSDVTRQLASLIVSRKEAKRRHDILKTRGEQMRVLAQIAKWEMEWWRDEITELLGIE